MIAINRDKIKCSDIFLFILSLLYIGCYYPAFYNQFLLGESVKGAKWAGIIGLIWIIFILVLKKPNRLQLPTMPFSLMLIIGGIYQLFRFIIYSEDAALSLIPHFVVSWIGVFLIINSFKQLHFMKFFLQFVFVMISFVLIGLILWGTIGIPTLSIIQWPGFDIYIINFGFFFAKFSNTLTSDFLRPAGWFDEPGSFVNVILYFLIYNKLFLKSRKVELFLIFGGLLTMSMAHLVISFIYIVFFYLTKKNIVYLFTIIIVILSLYLYHPKDDGIGEFVWKSIFGRTEKMLDGNDQSRNYSDSYKAFTHYGLTGASYQIIKQRFPDATTDTIWFFMAQNGVLGAMIYMLPILWVFVLLSKSRKLDLLNIKLLILLLLNMGQRPMFIFPLYLILIYFIWYGDGASSFLVYIKSKLR